MTLRFRIRLCASLFLFLVGIRAADFYTGESGPEPGHLVPRSGELLGHDSDIEESGSMNRTIVRFVKIAAFKPGSAFTVYEQIPKASVTKFNGWQNVPDNEKRYAIAVKVGIGGRREKPDYKRIDKPISREFAVAIQRVWAKALHLTRYPSHPYLGVDGATYVFTVSVTGFGWLEGQTWSPEKGTPRELVDMSVLLVQFFEQKAPPDLTEEVLIRKLQQLEAKIPEPPKS